MDTTRVTGNPGDKGVQQPGKQQGDRNPSQGGGGLRKEDPTKKKDLGGDFGRDKR
ncbi:hypothetical protein BH10PSE19_BH10PSE19_09240 [soil metagenome]